MSDIYGIGRNLKLVLQIYFLGMAQSGRTTKMIQSLHQRDLVVFDRADLAKWTERRARGLGIDIQYIIVDPCRIGELSQKLNGRPRPRKLVFDHNFIEKYYSIILNRGEIELNDLTKYFSIPDIENDVTEVERNWIKNDKTPY